MSGDVTIHVHAGSGAEVKTTQVAAEEGAPEFPWRHQGKTLSWKRQPQPVPGAGDMWTAQGEGGREYSILESTFQGVRQFQLSMRASGQESPRYYYFRLLSEAQMMGQHLENQSGVLNEEDCSHQHEGDPTVRPCPNPEAHESAPVVYEAPRRGSAQPRVASLPKSKRRTSLAASPLASAAGAAVGTMVAGVLAAEESAGDCLPWVKVERDPARYDECLKMGQKIGAVDTPRKVFDLLRGEFDKRDQECLVVLSCNIRGELRSKPIEVAYGQRSKVAVGVNDIMRAALVTGAEYIVIAHNHPSSKALPSKADRDLTKAVEEACEKCEVIFADHVVCGVNQFYSIKENKLYKV